MISRIQEFIEFAERCLGLGDPEKFWMLRDGFRAILQKDLWGKLMDEHMGKEKDSRWDCGTTGITVHDSINFSLRIVFNPPIGLNKIVNNSSHQESPSFLVRNSPSMISLVYPGEVEIDLFSSSKSFDCNVFDQSIVFEKCNKILIKSWDILEVDSPRVNARIQDASEICLIDLSMKSESSQAWEVCGRSGSPIKAILVGREEKEIISMLEEFRRVNYVDGEDCVVRMTRHRDFNVRWAAVQCLNAINPGAAIGVLKLLVDDPHPYISSTARFSLQKISRDGANG